MQKFGLNLKEMNTPELRKQGFQHAQTPDRTEGLLFIFPYPQTSAFHMRNVKFPLEIGFFDEQWKLLRSEIMKPERGTSLCLKKAKYAIEALPGWIYDAKLKMKQEGVVLQELHLHLLHAGFQVREKVKTSNKPITFKQRMVTAMVLPEKIPCLWYENDKGDKWVPNFDKGEGNPDEVPAGYDTQVSQFPSQLTTKYLRSVREEEVKACDHPEDHIHKDFGIIDTMEGRTCNKCGGYQSKNKGEEWPTKWEANGARDMFEAGSGWWEELALAMATCPDEKKRKPLGQAILIAATSCCRCMNALAYEYKVPSSDSSDSRCVYEYDGFPEYGPEWQKTATICEFCEADPKAMALDKKNKQNKYRVQNQDEMCRKAKPLTAKADKGVGQVLVRYDDGTIRQFNDPSDVGDFLIDKGVSKQDASFTWEDLPKKWGQFEAQKIEVFAVSSDHMNLVFNFFRNITKETMQKLKSSAEVVELSAALLRKLDKEFPNIMEATPYLIQDQPEYKRKHGLAAKLAQAGVQKVYIGDTGLDKTWQAPFAANTECSQPDCGANARIMFVMFEEYEKRDDTKHICELHENTGGEGKYWPHDAVAVAVYFCEKCAKPTALYNQG